MATNNELRVFISSTFRDLQEEREHLVKKIFPEIRALCRSRGVTFTDIDLRWGITEEEAEKEGIIRICLDEIDRCRPYFIGILGERYGWTPPRSDAVRVADKFPVLGDSLMNGASITEMEIMHGVLANPAMAGHAFFYFRDHDATPAEFVDTEPDVARRLHDLKERIRHSGFPVRENFKSPPELGLLLEEDLRRVVDIEHPASETPSPLELERRAHRAFAASRTRAYIANPEYDKRFNEWLTNEGRGVRAEDLRAEGSGLRDEELKPMRNPSPLVPQPTPLIPEFSALVITAESGLGKSSLIAHLVDEYRTSHPTAFVIEHYVGATQMSGTATAIMRQVINEIRERFGIADEAATKPDELERSFPNWLYRGEHLAKQSGVEMLIVIDAINQLDEAGRRLTWLPTVMPSGITFMVSTIPGPVAEELSHREWEHLDVRPIEDERTRRAIVLHYLGEFHKRITVDQLRRVTEDVNASSPLFLRVVAEELRLHGEHETLGAAIDRYAHAADLREVFDRVLERLERDYGVEPVRNVTSVIWESRSGLAEEEIMAIAGLHRVDLSRLLFALDYHLVQRGGALGFFHEYLRRAVEKRYLLKPRAHAERSTQLAAYFERAEVTIRSSLELLHALESLGDRERLERAAADISRVLLLWPGAMKDEILRVWSGSDRAAVVRAYRSSLADWVNGHAPGPARHAEALESIGELFRIIGALTDAESVQREHLALAREAGDRAGESRTLSVVAWLAMIQGRMDEAERLAREAEGVAREIGDQAAIAGAVGNRGVVHKNRDEHEEALACFAESESIARAMGDGKRVGEAVGNRGTVHKNRGEYEKALVCYAEQEAIARRMGDRHSIGMVSGNRGVVHIQRGDFEKALACHAEQEAIARTIGDRRVICYAVGNRGVVQWDRGEFDDALACFVEQESIARELGDRRSIGIAVGNQGNVHIERGEYREALTSYERALSEHRPIGFRHGVTFWLSQSAAAMLAVTEHATEPPGYLAHFAPEAVGAAWKQVCLATARVYAEECRVISRELLKHDTLHSSQVHLARIDAAEGRAEIAIEHLRTMLSEASDDGDRADLHYWLWKLGVAEHGATAHALYEALYAKTPKYEYKKRLEEFQIVD